MANRIPLHDLGIAQVENIITRSGRIKTRLVKWNAPLSAKAKKAFLRRLANG